MANTLGDQFVPFIIRLLVKIPTGTVSKEIVH
jgi:hypothetical protein